MRKLVKIKWTTDLKHRREIGCSVLNVIALHRNEWSNVVLDSDNLLTFVSKNRCCSNQHRIIALDKQTPKPPLDCPDHILWPYQEDILNQNDGSLVPEDSLMSNFPI